MTKAKTGIILLLALCAEAYASDWRPISTNTRKNITSYIDVSSIRISGDVRRAWIKIDTHNERSQKGTPPDHIISRHAYNCRDETKSIEAGTLYYRDGRIVSLSSENFPTAWELVTPDTADEAQMKFLCSWKP